MKINWGGIIAGIIAFGSLAWPWWTLIVTYSEIDITRYIFVYPYQLTASRLSVPSLRTDEVAAMALWFGWVSYAMIVAAGVIAIVASIMEEKKGKMLLLASGVLSLLSVLVFGVGIQIQLAAASPIVGFPVNQFQSVPSADITNYVYFLDYGFWIALIAAVVAFISTLWSRISKMFAPPKPKA